MNLHGIVRGAIGAVNPDIIVQIQVSDGYRTGSDFRQVPHYQGPYPIRAQVQPLSSQDLQQVDSVNMQGRMQAIYLYGTIEGVNRALGLGGDLITIGQEVWKVTQQLEAWPDWSKAAITLQVDEPA